MNEIFHLLLICLTANLDNLGVGIAYGIRRIKVPVTSNLAIAAIAFTFTYVSVLAGSYIGQFMSRGLANVGGALLLIGVGIWVMASQHRDAGESAAEPATDQAQHGAPLVLAVLQEPDKADLDHSGVISFGEALILGVGLSINCVTNGFSAGLWRLNPLPTAAITALFSYGTLWAGDWVGMTYAAEWLGNKATITAGVLLILLGFHQLLG